MCGDQLMTVTDTLLPLHHTPCTVLVLFCNGLSASDSDLTGSGTSPQLGTGVPLKPTEERIISNLTGPAYC